jgi:hypothetical protein
MEKLPLLIHGKPITDQGGEDNVGMKHRLRLIAKAQKQTGRF